MKIGVIGLGAVGYPLYKALQFYHEPKTIDGSHDNVFCYDITKSSDLWYKVIETDIVFICVPTQPKPDGRLDMSIVDDTLKKLSKSKYNGIVVIKSTLGLGYINKAIKKYPLEIIIFPEWLYAKNAFPDTLKPEMTVVGVPEVEHKSEILRNLFNTCLWHNINDAFIVKPEEAVMIKLTANSLASTKISFANQIDLICKQYHIDSKIVMDTIKCDPRCSPRYLTPGAPFSGHCLPKDTNELKNSIKENHLLKGVCDINKIFLKQKP